MIDNKIIEVCAEVDGFKWMRDPSDNHLCWYQKDTKWFCGKCLFESDVPPPDFEALPDYLCDYNAIIPLVNKQPFGIICDVWWACRRSRAFLPQPREICVELVKALCKWED